MHSVLNQLQPARVWQMFEDICQVPRPSKKEERIGQFLMDFARSHNLNARKDEAGNVLICKPGTKGREGRPVVILQSHMDMVCEKNSDSAHDFENDPIIPYIDGEWVKAKGTTLGADDGIGMAAQMAILVADDIEHGPLECLFTVDEETGLTGAAALKPGFMNGKILLNLDSEDEGELFIGCAGGIDTVAYLDFKRRVVPINHAAYKVSVSGLKGGHSGDDIHRGLGNANKILTRFLWEAMREHKVRLAHIDGGNLRNAIAREARAVIMVPMKAETPLLEYARTFAAAVTEEIGMVEPNVQIKFETTTQPDYIINKRSARRLINALYACPHGVIAMSQRMPGMVETSTNLASVKVREDNVVMITTSQRSDLESAKIDIARMVESVFLLAGCRVTHSDGYPGWAPNPASAILKTTVDSYRDLFGHEPVVRSIHAGLECGLFLEKYPYLDMVSFGPTLRGVHSPDERINIPSVQKFWDHLINILKRV